MAYEKRRNIVVGNTMWNKLKELAKSEERSVSDLIREAVADLLRKRSSYDAVKDRYH